jgi:hypothetical protein
MFKRVWCALPRRHICFSLAGDDWDVCSWHDADHRNGAKHVGFAPRVQTSTCSAIASASSTSIPR